MTTLSPETATTRPSRKNSSSRKSWPSPTSGRAVDDGARFPQSYRQVIRRIQRFSVALLLVVGGLQARAQQQQPGRPAPSANAAEQAGSSETTPLPDVLAMM